MTRRTWDQPIAEAKVSFPADHVVEWYIENNDDTYRRMTVTGAPSRLEHRFGDAMPTRVKTHGVVCLVLEVPLPELEKVTTQLRGSSKIRTAAPYLKRAAEAAGNEAPMMERMARLELENKKLRKLALDNASVLDKYDQRIVQAERELDEPLKARLVPCYPTSVSSQHRKLGMRWTADTQNQLNMIEVQATEELNKIRSVLDEQRADVAAKLLAKLPDGDW